MSEREEYTGVIVPRFWAELRHLPLDVRALAAHLVTGRHNEGVPGCAVVGMPTLADELDVTPEQLGELWAKLEKGMPGFAEYDRTHRVLRMRNVPKIGHAPNHNVIRGWWRRWRALPEAPLKYAHIESLRQSLPPEPSELVMKTWAATFGSVQMPDVVTDEPMRAATAASTGGVMDASMGGVMGEVIHDPIGGPTDSGYGQCSLVSVVATPESGGKSTPRAHARSQGTGAQVALLPGTEAPPAAVSPVTALRGAFCEWFTAHYGREYAWTGEEAGKAKRLLDANHAGEGGGDEVMRRVKRAAAQTWRDTDVDLGAVLGGWNKLAATARASPKTHQGYVGVTGKETYRDGVVEDF